MTKRVFITADQKSILLNASASEWESVKEHLPANMNKSRANVYRRNLGLEPFPKVSVGARAWTNDDFFNDKSLVSCAYAGMIAADGCIGDKGVKQPRISLSLDSKDVEYLDLMKCALGGTVTSSRSMSTWRASSAKMAKALDENFNIRPRKSLTLTPPEGLSADQSLAFIAGYIDGDGCYGLHDYKSRPTLQILGTKAVLEWINYWIFDETGCPRPKEKGKLNGVWTLRAAGDDAILARSRYIGLDIPRLHRKKFLWESRGANLDLMGRGKIVQ